MGLQIDSSAAPVIVDDATMLAEVQRAIRDIYATGQAYSIAGARSFTAASLPELQKAEQMYRRRVLAAAGFSGHNIADHRITDDTARGLA